MLNVLELDIPNFSDFFPDLPWPRARRRVAKSILLRRRLAKRNAVLHALAADRPGTGREVARALYSELRRYAAGRTSRSAVADARALLLRRFFRLNGARLLSEGAIRSILVNFGPKSVRPAGLSTAPRLTEQELSRAAR